MVYETTLECIKEIKSINGVSTRFTTEKRYRVAYNHLNLVSLIDESGYKMNFSRNPEDLNLPYIWDYFSISDELMLQLKIVKVV